MKSLREWAEHYGHDPASDEAKAEYKEYREQLGLLTDLAAPEDLDTPPCPAPGEGSDQSDDPRP